MSQYKLLVSLFPKPLLGSAVNQLRAYDAVQLATSLAVYDELLAIGAIAAGHPYVLVSADNELNNAASLEGLAIENPNNYP